MRRSDLAPPLLPRLRRYPPPWQAHYGVAAPPPRTEPLDLSPVAGDLDRAGRALARARILLDLAANAFLLTRVLARREAVGSSSIEGTHSTLDQLLSVEAWEDPDLAPEPARQVRDYALALEVALDAARERGPEVFSVELIADLHARAMSRDVEYRRKHGPPGQVKRKVNWIGGRGRIETSVYNPNAPEDVMAGLADQVDYLRGGAHQQTQPLIARMAIAHAHFEAVHPFADGNGRVGRLLLPLMMAAEGEPPLYLATWFEAHRSSYMDGLRLAQQRLDPVPLTAVFVRAVISAVEDVERSSRELGKLRQDWRNRRRWRANSTALRAIDLLQGYPVITVNRLAGLLGVSFRAASTAVDQLVEVGILEERTGRSRNRVFAAPEVLDVYSAGLSAEDE